MLPCHIWRQSILLMFAMTLVVFESRSQTVFSTKFNVDSILNHPGEFFLSDSLQMFYIGRDRIFKRNRKSNTDQRIVPSGNYECYLDVALKQLKNFFIQIKGHFTRDIYMKGNKFGDKLQIDVFIGEDVKLQNLGFNNFTMYGLVLSGSIIESLEISDGSLKHVRLSHTHITQSFCIRNVKLQSAQFEGFELPRSIVLENLDLSELNGEIDLSRVIKTGQTCSLYIDKVDVTKLKLRYSDYTICFSENVGTEDRYAVYQQLLEKFEKDGQFESKRKLDIEFKSFKYKCEGKYMEDYIDRLWWNYGYDRKLVIYNSLLIFVFFLFTNLFLFRYLADVYMPVQFRILDSKLMDKYGSIKGKKAIKYRLYKTPLILIYTAYVFWGLKLDFKDVSIKIGLVLLLTEYIAGLICLAYIANYLITI